MGRQRRHGAVGRSFLAVAAIGLLLAPTPGPAYADQSASIVDEPRPVADWGYEPREIAPSAGEWVTWSNDGQEVHSVTAVDGSFDSGELAPSEGFSWYFDQPGVFDYYCVLHEWMQGRVVVVVAPAVPSTEVGAGASEAGEPLTDE